MAKAHAQGRASVCMVASGHNQPLLIGMVYGWVSQDSEADRVGRTSALAQAVLAEAACWST
eukprot:15431192-Alexandrium_andersonii.AAC.1